MYPFNSEFRAVQLVAQGPLGLRERPLPDPRLVAGRPVHGARRARRPELYPAAPPVRQVHQGRAALALGLRALLPDIPVPGVRDQRVRGAGDRDRDGRDGRRPEARGHRWRYCDLGCLCLAVVWGLMVDLENFSDEFRLECGVF